MKHIWTGRSADGVSPEAIFAAPLKLRELLRYVLNSGDVPNASIMRSALRYWKHNGVYNFRPSAAKALVDRYCPTGGTVLDPCAGYGGRLLGTLLSSAQARYIGIDPSTETHAGLLRLNDWVLGYLPELQGRVEVRCEPAEDATFPEQVDMVLTSPPYWGREVYSDEDTQSSYRYPTYTEWLQKFWRTVLEKSIQALKPGGWLVLNVDDFELEGKPYGLVSDTVHFVADLGLGRADRLQYNLPGAKGSKLRAEAVLCWVKGQHVSQKPHPAITTSVSTCTGCGKAVSVEDLMCGLCPTCLTPKGTPRICLGCGIAFQATRSDHLYHDDVCYARCRRRQERIANPVSGIRTFICKTCGKAWQTDQLGQFTLCPECKTAKAINARQKTCAYRHCGKEFTDTSSKNCTQYCCEEHRRREKAFRDGKAKDESYFRVNKPKLDPLCMTCGNRFPRTSDERVVRCPACRSATRNKVCPKCSQPFEDTSSNATRKFCSTCSPRELVQCVVSSESGMNMTDWLEDSTLIRASGHRGRRGKLLYKMLHPDSLDLKGNPCDFQDADGAKVNVKVSRWNSRSGASLKHWSFARGSCFQSDTSACLCLDAMGVVIREYRVPSSVWGAREVIHIRTTGQWDQYLVPVVQQGVKLPTSYWNSKHSLSLSQAEEAVKQLALDAPQIVDSVLAILLRTACPCRRYTKEQLSRNFASLQTSSVQVANDNIQGMFHSGVLICNHFFAHRYTARYKGLPSVLDAWGDPQWLRRAIALQLRLVDPLKPRNVLRALSAILRAPTNFRPSVAKAIVSEYCPKGGVVLDPCAGYGGRAVGALAAGCRYVGVDPHPKASEAFTTLFEFLKAPLDWAQVYQAAFEDVSLGELQADFAFTSPPYFSIERYSDDSTQSWVRYSTWSSWVEGFLVPLFKKVWQHLKPGCVFCLNVNDAKFGSKTYPLIETSLEIGQRLGFSHERTISMPLGRFGKTSKSEPILVFRKPRLG